MRRLRRPHEHGKANRSGVLLHRCDRIARRRRNALVCAPAREAALFEAVGEYRIAGMQYLREAKFQQRPVRDQKAQPGVAGGDEPRGCGLRMRDDPPERRRFVPACHDLDPRFARARGDSRLRIDDDGTHPEARGISRNGQRGEAASEDHQPRNRIAHQRPGTTRVASIRIEWLIRRANAGQFRSTRWNGADSSARCSGRA